MQHRATLNDLIRVVGVFSLLYDTKPYSSHLYDEICASYNIKNKIKVDLYAQHTFVQFLASGYRICSGTHTSTTHF